MKVWVVILTAQACGCESYSGAASVCTSLDSREDCGNFTQIKQKERHEGVLFISGAQKRIGSTIPTLAQPALKLLKNKN
jgi:hypothetical protein